MSLSALGHPKIERSSSFNIGSGSGSLSARGRQLAGLEQCARRHGGARAPRRDGTPRRAVRGLPRGLQPVEAPPSPGTHAILTVLKAGETVYQAGELPKTLRVSKIQYGPPKTVCETPFASIFPASTENGDGTRLLAFFLKRPAALLGRAVTFARVFRKIRRLQVRTSETQNAREKGGLA